MKKIKKIGKRCSKRKINGRKDAQKESRDRHWGIKEAMSRNVINRFGYDLLILYSIE